MARRNLLAAPEGIGAILERGGDSRSARARAAIDPRTWREAVGARIADRARPLSLFDGVLLLRVPTSVWAHELSLLSEEVCVRLRDRGIDARELRFRVGALPAVDRPPERRMSRAVPPARPAPPSLARALAEVDDDELRAAIASAASSNLAWQSFATPAGPCDVSEARRAARAPRGAGARSAPPARAKPASRGASPHKPSGGSGRSR
jgi:hypothetical protein